MLKFTTVTSHHHDEGGAPQSRSGLRSVGRLTLALFLAVALAGCGGGSGSTGPDPDPDPDPGPGPGPQQPVSFAADIEPIFNGSCAVSGCHNSSTQESGVDLSSYGAALSSVGDQYGTEIIEPGDPSASPIIDKISSNNPEFGERMPLDRSALSQSEIDSIRAWIQDGAPDN